MTDFRRFKIGVRVKLTRMAADMFPTYDGEVGTVTGYTRDGFVRVRFDKHKLVSRWNATLLSPSTAQGYKALRNALAVSS